jgi:hypothetical protein
MQMKIGRWEGLYPRIQSAAKHIRCGFVCGYRKIAGLFRSERSAIIGAAQPGIHGPDPSEDRATKKSKSNESIEQHFASGPCLIAISPQSVANRSCPIGNIFAARAKRELSNRQ